MKKRLLSLCLVLALALSLLPAAAAAEHDLSDQLEEYIVAALNAKKAHAKPALSPDENLLPLFDISDTAYDWTALAIGRFGCRDDDGYHFLYHDGDGYEEYLEAMKSYVTATYAQNGGKLHRVKATEWHRLILAVNALGGDPTDFGTYNDAPVDLVNDGTYNHPAPGKQGINGSIFALIALDSMGYEVPDEVVTTRAQFIENILALQLTDGADDNQLGGWALSGAVSDPDISAMSIQALAPYYEDDTEYTYTNKALKAEVTQTVADAVDAALDRLGELQRADGDFASWGTVNVESTAQVLVALCALGIDPAKDDRFIKGDNTLLDGILKFHLSDGGFTHAYGEPDPDNPTADPGEFNNMATDQATYALVAYWRFENGLSSLYDMAPDWRDREPEPEPDPEPEPEPEPQPTPSSKPTTQTRPTTDPSPTTEPEPEPEPITEPEPSVPVIVKHLSDVPDDHWAKSAVEFVTTSGLFQGTSENEFSPTMPMTRAMLMTVLARQKGVETADGSSWYTKGLAWAVEQGISDGADPEGLITREQLAVMLYRYAGAPMLTTTGGLTAFADTADVSDWAEDALRWAVSQGIMTGKDGLRLDPQGLASRAEAAMMLQRAAGLRAQAD